MAHNTTHFAQWVFCERTAEFLSGLSDGLAHATPFDLGWRSRRVRDFPVSRPCVIPALATSTRSPQSPFQTTHTRRITSLSYPACRRQERRRWQSVEPVLNAFLQVTKHRPALSSTRGDRRPNPFAPAPPGFAPRPLRDVPINHHETYGLLRQIIRGLNTGCCDKREIGVSAALRHESRIARWPGARARQRDRGMRIRARVEGGWRNEQETPRNQATTWLRDLTVGSKTSLGSRFIASSLWDTASAVSSWSRAPLSSQGL